MYIWCKYIFLILCSCVCVTKHPVHIWILQCGSFHKICQRCIHVLQYVAVCCSMLQYVAVCCRVLQYTRFQSTAVYPVDIWGCSVLQCVAVCCSVLQCVVVCCSVLQYTRYTCESCDATALTKSVNNAFILCRALYSYFAEHCSMLQCVAVCCSVLQCVAVYPGTHVILATLQPSQNRQWCFHVLQHVAVCCSVLQCVLQYVAVYPVHIWILRRRSLHKIGQRCVRNCHVDPLGVRDSIGHWLRCFQRPFGSR